MLQGKQGLSDKEILYFYKNILVYCEEEIVRHFRIDSKCVKDFIKDERINIHPATTGNPVFRLEKIYEDKSSFFSFKIHKKQGQVNALFKHFRNTVAHCNVNRQKIANRWFYVFIDKDRGKLTMTGKIPVKKLEPFIVALKQSERMNT
ncbi:MAG: hypothetical protein PHV45_09150 [Desulfuromonas thiophila]|nr:hypothetical protein [Desulfuromonas thiophila]